MTQRRAASFPRRLAQTLLPAETANRILLGGLTFIGVAVGSAWGCVVGDAAGQSGGTLIGAVAGGIVGALMYWGLTLVTEGGIRALYGHGRLVDQRRLLLEDLSDRARTAERSLQFAEAVALYRRILHENLAERPAWVWFKIGEIRAERLRDYRRAVPALRSAVDLLTAGGTKEPAEERDVLLLRRCREILDVLALRIAEADKGIAARREEIARLVGEANYDEALAVVERLWEDDPEDAENNFLKGFVLARTGKHHLAVEFYGRAAAADPSHTRALYNLAASLDVLDRDEEAIVAYERFLEVAASDPREAEWIEQARLQLAGLRRAVRPTVSPAEHA